MNKIMIGALFGLFILIVISIGAKTNNTPILSYVYSDSMEPVIKVNDVYVVLPEKEYGIGDIIMYRPAVLEAEYITHRIIGIGNNGYITRGDNSIYSDQESNEPEVLQDRIVGRVFTINGQPLILPFIGFVSNKGQSFLGGFTKYLSALFLLIGIISLVKGNLLQKQKRRFRTRLRLKHIYRIIIIIGVTVVITSIYYGSRVTGIRYLVSEYPGTRGDHIAVNETDQIMLNVSNNGVVPVWSVISGITPIYYEEEVQYISVRSQKEISLMVRPHSITGLYRGYVQIYNYPVILPRSWVSFLHSIHPFVAMVSVGIVFGIYLLILMRCLEHIPGFESWIPLRAIKDKIAERRMKRARARLLGRRRKRL